MILCHATIKLFTNNDGDSFNDCCIVLCERFCSAVRSFKDPSTIQNSRRHVLRLQSSFRAIYGEFLQKHDGTRNDMTSRSADSITLVPNGNLQGGIRSFSLPTGLTMQC